VPDTDMPLPDSVEMTTVHFTDNQATN